MIHVVKAKLLLIQEQPDDYNVYIFQDLSTYAYVWVTKLPNWNMITIPRVGDIGFLKYKTVEAGDDMWYDNVNNIKVPYKCTGEYFEGFVHEKEPTRELTL